jgi:hypothetical protein
MDKLTRYRELMRRLVEHHARYQPSNGEIEAIAVCDEARDHYQLLHLGWSLQGRVFAVILHMRLRDGKIWIEQDGTAEGAAPALVEAGVPTEDIVLAFYPLWKRRLTDYAVA